MSTRIWFAFIALLITSGISGTAQERAPERVSLDALLTRAALVSRLLRRSIRERRLDPHGPDSGEKRVIRGGSWYFDANSARCGLRYTHAPQDRGFSLGFRLAADRR
ncbi:MAG: hypothetical protein AUF76_12320 [Acidobacteria bacterium 13_1_20CM_2_65_9]|nr:MAG: hypothetical protein AUF76_12320 [Acidobacteria bacterium 13_1_20CM_2_65_9]